MPYRALIATLVTVGLALLAVGMWAAVVGPMVSAAHNDDAIAPHTGPAATLPGTSTLQLDALTRAVLILSFLLVLTLLIVGVASTFRAWMNVRRPGRRRIRTRYVDAWKLSADRLETEAADQLEPDDEGPEEDGPEEKGPGESPDEPPGEPPEGPRGKPPKKPDGRWQR